MGVIKIQRILRWIFRLIGILWIFHLRPLFFRKSSWWIFVQTHCSLGPFVVVGRNGEHVTPAGVETKRGRSGKFSDLIRNAFVSKLKADRDAGVLADAAPEDTNAGVHRRRSGRHLLDAQFVDQIDVAVGAAVKSKAVFSFALRAKHGHRVYYAVG